LKIILENSIYFFIGLLFLVWPMNHLIAIRNIDIGIIFLLSGILFFYYRENIKYPIYFKYIFMILILFFGWIFLISYFSEYKEYALHEIKNQLLMPILLIISSFFLINAKINYKNLFIISFSMTYIFILYHALFAFNYYIYNHSLPLRSYGITVGLDELNFLMPFIFTFFTVEIIFRILKKSSLLPISNFLLFILLSISIFSLIVQDKRNGIISVITMIISILFLIFLIKDKFTKKNIFILILGLFIIGSLAYIDFKIDPRWEKFSKTVKVVFIDNDKSFLNKKIPENVDDSAYGRLFYIKEGIQLIYENPLGYGYGREIFGKAVAKKYNIDFHTHSHSGVIDLMVGVGIIGFILWSVLIFTIIYIGFKNFIKYKNYYALFSMFLATSFYFRMFLDSINRDHILEQFVFLLSLSLFAMQKELNEKNNLPSS